MHADEVDVDGSLVRRLLAAQMPDLADRRLTVVEPWGTDNAIWRLGHDLVLRLPRIHWAATQPDLEARVLPRLSPHLPVALPEPVAVGEPGEGYPYRWAVHRWLPGEAATVASMGDPLVFARDLARVVQALHAVPPDDAPPATNRARDLRSYDDRDPGRHRLRRRVARRGVGAGGVGAGAGRARPPGTPGVGPRRPRGELPRAQRAALGHRRLGLGLRR